MRALHGAFTFGKEVLVFFATMISDVVGAKWGTCPLWRGTYQLGIKCRSQSVVEGTVILDIQKIIWDNKVCL